MNSLFPKPPDSEIETFFKRQKKPSSIFCHDFLAQSSAIKETPIGKQAIFQLLCFEKYKQFTFAESNF